MDPLRIISMYIMSYVSVFIIGSLFQFRPFDLRTNKHSVRSSEMQDTTIQSEQLHSVSYKTLINSGLNSHFLRLNLKDC